MSHKLLSKEEFMTSAFNACLFCHNYIQALDIKYSFMEGEAINSPSFASIESRLRNICSWRYYLFIGVNEFTIAWTIPLILLHNNKIINVVQFSCQ